MATKSLLPSSPPRSTRERDPRPTPPRELPDEISIQNDAVSLCLLVNRRHGHLRVIDFRAGPTVAKRNIVLVAAKKAGIDKVFTLVERDEVATWMRLGFEREGSIPGFYRRNDAWIMGIVVPQAKALSPSGLAAIDEDDDDLPMEAPVSPAALAAEKTVARAKKLIREEAAASGSVKLAPISAADAEKAVLAAQKKGTALTGLERFGRDTTRTTYVASIRGVTLHLSAEAQPFFHNSFVELLTSPKNDSERLAATAAMGMLTEKLRAEGSVNVFAIVPADDVMLAAVMLASGFRRSAALASHLVIGAERKDAVVWGKKLSPTD